MVITTLLMLHGILAVFLLGAVTHQFLGVVWPRQLQFDDDSACNDWERRVILHLTNCPWFAFLCA